MRYQPGNWGGRRETLEGSVYKVLIAVWMAEHLPRSTEIVNHFLKFVLLLLSDFKCKVEMEFAKKKFKILFLF